MKNKIKYVILVVLIFCFSIELKSGDQSLFYNFGKKYDAQMFAFTDGDSVSVNIFYRISNNSLNYKKTQKSGETVYKAEKMIEFVIMNHHHIIKKRILKNIEDYVIDYESTISKDIFKEFHFHYKLPIASYNIKLDFNKSRRMKGGMGGMGGGGHGGHHGGGGGGSKGEGGEGGEDHMGGMGTKFTFHLMSGRYDPFFVHLDADANYNPTYIKSGFDFSSDFVKMLIPVSAQDEIGDVEIVPVDDSEIDFDEYKYWYFNTISVDRVDFELENISKNISENIDFKGNDIPVVSINISDYQLEPGEYFLNYKLNGKELSKKFLVEWDNQPLSLANLDLAVKSMKPILRDEEYDSLLSGNDETNANNFYKFWKNRDPDKNTAFNEAMNQYFSRVDFSFFNYSTIVEKNGSRTDRGKIYTLYGPPDKVINRRIDGNPSEIWYYKNRGERFIFNVVSNGIYRLEKIEKI
jgi:GWxTD domain-containing protein